MLRYATRLVPNRGANNDTPCCKPQRGPMPVLTVIHSRSCRPCSGSSGPRARSCQTVRLNLDGQRPISSTYTVRSAAHSAKDLALAGFIDPASPLAITPVIHPNHGVPDLYSRRFWTAPVSGPYIIRRHGIDLFGQTPDLADNLAQGTTKGSRPQGVDRLR